MGTNRAAIDAITADPRWPSVAPQVADLVEGNIDADETSDPHALFYALYSLGECYYDEPDPRFAKWSKHYEAAAMLRLEGDEDDAYVDEWYGFADRYLPVSAPAKACVRNLTPHPITLLVGDQQVTLQPDGPAARVVRLPDVDDGTISIGELTVPLRRTALGTEVTDLPELVDGVTLIVARLVCEARPDRGDLVFVDGVVRDEQGRVVGATALARIAR